MLLLLAATTLLFAPQRPGDLEALLDGVGTLPRLGVPGPVCAFGPEAFPVLTGRLGGAAVPVVAAARYGRGRAVAFGHGAWLGPGGWRTPGGARMLVNAIRWAGGQPAGSPPLQVALDGVPEATAGFLREQGFQVVTADAAGPEAPQVLLWSGRVPTAEERLAELRRFLRDGGGLVCGTCPWGVQQIHAASGFRIATDLPENRVLAPAGLVFADGYVEGTGPGGFPVAASHPEVAHAGRALDLLLDGLDAPAADPKVRRQALGTVELALQAVPEGSGFLERVEAACGSLTDRVPGPERPVTTAMPQARLGMLAWWRRHREDPAGTATVAPGADFFPGPVPGDAPRLERTLTVPAGRRGWISTGLYAPPGETVTVLAAPDLPPGWRLRIGCHADALWSQEQWKRWPEVSRSWPLCPGRNRFASPFGGLLYLEAPGAGAALAFTLAGAVEAPFFDLQDPGSAADWARRRDAPAPWAELQGRHLVITVPAAGVRDLDDPAPVLRWWDRVLAAQAWLAARPPATARPERFVADIQISAGYMHAGYPVMTWLDVATPKTEGELPFVLDLATLAAEGSWGHFHELGHNLQRPWWTFAGTGEVTNNLFTLYAMDLVVGIEPWQHPWLETQKAKEGPYLEGGAEFPAWQRDPGLALVFFARIQRAFGWEPFRRFFAAGEALAAGKRPEGEEAERDAWLVGLSRECGRDLGPFFERWGIPVSAGPREAAQAAGPPWDGMAARSAPSPGSAPPTRSP